MEDCRSMQKLVEACGNMWMPVEVCGSILHDTCTRFGGFCVCAHVDVCTRAQVLVDMREVCISDPGHVCNVGVSGMGGACMHMYVWWGVCI